MYAKIEFVVLSSVNLIGLRYASMIILYSACQVLNWCYTTRYVCHILIFNLLVPLDDFLLFHEFNFIEHALCFHSGCSALVESAALALLPVFAIDFALAAIS